MTRIAAGTAAPNASHACRPSGAPPEAQTAVGAASTRTLSTSAPSDPDRPARLGGAGPNRSGLDAQTICKELLGWEGNKPFMYLDKRGYVTTGIGNKLTNASEAIALPWQHRGTGVPATPAEIRSAFERVNAMSSEFVGRPDGNSYGSRHYERETDLVLPENFATHLAISRLETDFLPKLRGLFPGFDRYPAPAQSALVDMAYTLGVGGLRAKFPNFVAACRRGDFATAAAECHRKAQGNESRKGDARNVATRDLLLEAARLAASVQSHGGQVRL
jgi:GH24 family phage-related lysozyme (muramidase)